MLFDGANLDRAEAVVDRLVGFQRGYDLARAATRAHSAEMNQADALLKIVAMAKLGGALPPEEAMCMLASLIDKLDKHSASYETDVAALVKVGATIWNLSSGSDGAHDPAWVPPFLRH